MTDFLYLFTFHPMFLLRYYLSVAKEKVDGAITSIKGRIERLQATPGLLQG
jgi:hypothetical protein